MPNVGSLSGIMMHGYWILLLDIDTHHPSPSLIAIMSGKVAGARSRKDNCGTSMVSGTSAGRIAVDRGKKCMVIVAAAIAIAWAAGRWWY